MPDSKILIIEDNENLRFVLAKQLETICNINADFAKDGREAIELFTKKKYAVVFSDIAMPVMDGLTTCQVMRALEKKENRIKTPIIALTGCVNYSDQAMAAGMDGFLTKPISLQKFSEIIQTFIDIHPC